ncbi:alginate export family protein [Microbulbifer sp. OS29]|uniref:Alginate export family protein n=1 Tax=Microbulbifer okhotskensis TaxID=2926617 RepID=A0A9X2ETD6_9GAMM|nr:alginate export family protein [Microbulbifer okhotskensis]MCO1335376.1 alginate export family protein [Microbulbifer okhotskensis]
MKEQKLSTAVAAIILGVSASQVGAVENGSATLIDALTLGEVGVNLRYRVEHVDQDNINDVAIASTLRTRLNWTSGSYRSFDAFFEVDNVSGIGNDNYNSTVNGNSEHPVVADPEGTEVNQAYLQYRAGNSAVIVGRQRINLDSQRFIGSVGWRQNEQTYDGLRYQYGAEGQLQLDYSYLYNVNRIFGEDSDRADLDGDIQLFHASYPLVENHKLTAFFYNLDLDNASSFAARTYGAAYRGDFGRFETQLSYARQQDIGSNPSDYAADYYLAEIAAPLGPVTGKLGYEVLGSDSGVSFKTPLATLHKFQGFTDQFLVTPADGIEDLYIGGSLAWAGGDLGITYHNFEASEGSENYGNEWNISYSHKFDQHFSALVKYANYDAEDYSSDTDKFWLMLTAKF